MVAEALKNPEGFDKTQLSKVGAADKSISGINGTELTWTDADNLSKVSRIMYVKVGETEFEFYNSTEQYTKELVVEEGEKVGYVQITKTSVGKIVISLYFTKNCTIQTTVIDCDGNKTTTRLEVTGIDKSLNDNGKPISDNEYMKADASSIAWLYSNILEVGS